MEKTKGKPKTDGDACGCLFFWLFTGVFLYSVSLTLMWILAGAPPLFRG